VARELALGGVDAVLVAGDLNLVGSRAPLERLAAGLDPAGGDLVVARALHPDGRDGWTWSAPRSAYTPGRLDYMLSSPSSLRVAAAFVLDTADLSPAVCARHGLEPGDARAASDHLPIVARVRI